MVAGWMLDPDTKSIKKEHDFELLCEIYSGSTPSPTAVSPVVQFEIDLQTICSITKKLEALLVQESLMAPFLQQEMPLAPVLCRLELLGIGFDKQFLTSFKQLLESRMEELEQQAYAMVGHSFLITSPQQVSKGNQRQLIFLLNCNYSVLYDELRLKRYSSVNEESLNELNHPMAKIILEYRKYKKLLSTYIESIVNKAVPIIYVRNFKSRNINIANRSQSISLR